MHLPKLTAIFHPKMEAHQLNFNVLVIFLFFILYRNIST